MSLTEDQRRGFRLFLLRLLGTRSLPYVVADDADPPEHHNFLAARIEAANVSRNPTRRASGPYPLLRYPLLYDEAPALPDIFAPFGGADLCLDRVGARGELAGSETQAAGGPASLGLPSYLYIS